jgi:hypothetical protein
MKKSLHALAACMAFALAAQVPASSLASEHLAAPNGPTDKIPAGAVVLPTATLDAITGAVNWRKVACWTGVVGVAVGVSLVGSPGLGAGMSAAMAVACLALH